MSYLLIACRTLLLGVFLAAVAGKVRRRAAHREFVASLRALHVVPPRLTAAAAAAVTTTEAAVVVLLAVPATVPAGFALAAVLLAAFTTAIGRALRRGERAPCPCFGASSTPLGGVHVARNLVLLAVAGAGLAAVAGSGGGTRFAGVVLAVAAALVALVPVLRLDDLTALFRASARPTRTGGSRP